MVGSRTRTVARFGLGLSLFMLLASAWLAFGPRGDIFFRQACVGSTLSAYAHPQPEDPGLEAIGFVDASRLCNEDAVERTRQAAGLLGTGLVLAVGSGIARLRQRR